MRRFLISLVLATSGILVTAISVVADSIRNCS